MRDFDPVTTSYAICAPGEVNGDDQFRYVMTGQNS